MPIKTSEEEKKKVEKSQPETQTHARNKNPARNTNNTKSAMKPINSRKNKLNSKLS